MPDTLIIRGLLGALVAGAVAWAARRAGSLTPRGQWAAFLLGSVVAAAGWTWAILLIAFFVVSSALTRFGAAEKAARTVSVLPDASARNAVQVLANGAVYALLVVLGAATDRPALLAAAVGALAAAAADTWATEIGTLWGGTPRRVTGFARVEPGTSGGITAAGTLAGVVAAALLGATATWILPQGRAAGIAVLWAGIAGMLADSLIGATLQSRRWCKQCRAWTERRVHTCQYRTQHAGGLRWMTNDTVNLVATAIGAGVAFALAAAPA